ncbi:hypothetical protein BGZ65_010651, partial [Modicella reniformis]
YQVWKTRKNKKDQKDKGEIKKRHETAQKEEQPETNRSKANKKTKALRRLYRTRTITIRCVEGYMTRKRMELSSNEWREQDQALFGNLPATSAGLSTLSPSPGMTPQQAHDRLKEIFEQRKQRCRQEVLRLSGRLTTQR